MSLGFGRKTPKDYADLQTGGPVDDSVPAGKYMVKAENFFHLKPDAKRQTGCYFLRCKTTEDNAEHADKRLSLRFNYHPAPQTANYEAMNDISEQNMKGTLESANSEPIVENGVVDLVASIERLTKVGSTFPVQVAKGTDKQGNPVQNVTATTLE